MGYLRLPKLLFRIATGSAKKLDLRVTKMCNLRCKNCSIWKENLGNYGYSSELDCDKFDEFFRRHNYWSWISFTGGEPFTRKDLVKIVEIAVRRCSGLHTISIPTNGLLTEKIVKDVLALTRLGIPSIYISVSLDGPRKIHNDLRENDRVFDNAVSTFQKLRSLRSPGLKVHFEFLISKRNQGLLRKTISDLGLSPNDFVLTIAQNGFFYDNLSLEVKPEEEALKREIRWFMSGLKLTSPHNYAQLMFLSYVCKDIPLPCAAGRNSFFMDEQGSVYPCILVPKKIGDWHSETFDSFSKESCCPCRTPCQAYFPLLLEFPLPILRTVFS